MTSALFSPFTLRDLTVANRIVVSPMCEYSAVGGCATDWHVIHLGHLALSGAGLLIVEATAVNAQGRISRECLGLYSDENEAALARVLAVVRRYSAMPIGIQLNHAGRKGSQRKPGDGRGNVPSAKAAGRRSARPRSPSSRTGRRRTSSIAQAWKRSSTHSCTRRDVAFASAST